VGLELGGQWVVWTRIRTVELNIWTMYHEYLKYVGGRARVVCHADQFFLFLIYFKQCRSTLIEWILYFNVVGLSLCEKDSGFDHSACIRVYLLLYGSQFPINDLLYSGFTSL